MDISQINSSGESCNFCDRPHTQKTIAVMTTCSKVASGSRLIARACDKCLKDVQTHITLINKEYLENL
jgi:hypothetical protein